MNKQLTIAGTTLDSRLWFGTGKNVPFDIMKSCIEASGAQVVTCAIRRVPLDQKDGQNLLEYLRGLHVLPNTAMCYNTKDAILTAQLARELLETNWVKLEVIGDPETLLPDNEATLEAARELVKDGFIVLPYCSDDPIVCRKLEEIGCAAVMPLAAPIGSGLGIRNPTNLQIIKAKSGIPVIVDAGVGTASDAAFAMELGMDAVLLQSAVYGAQNPLQMARAMNLAVESGRLAFEAGRMPKRLYGSASSPIEGVVNS
ncbi:thiazole-phosphate synthase [Abditibacterium utsteinense]|uniref:Thiazole synthase n=1 Tax=Abditibacterium utsteinense TaxID=1960156 RepID=A0A2S8SXA3_9BACT|nr:thiazole synthase [Abditibacterium utsteinense]PQV65416.1 thiazole-phosphate synthase [Abditibacterium utsteinense]